MTILIVLASLRAEGTPHMALSMSRIWLSQGWQPVVLELGRGSPDLRPAFEQQGITIHTLPVGHRGYSRYGALAYGTFRICRLLRPRGVLCMPFGIHSFVAAGARAAGVERVCAHVGNPPLPSAGTAMTKFRALVQLGRPLTHRLICCSRYVQGATVRHLKVPERETSVVYNGIDIERFSASGPQRSTNRDERARWVIGMVATLEAHKDQATLIQAAARLQREGLDLEVRLIGDGSRREFLQQLVNELGAPVTLLGARTDIPEQIAEMDLFVFSTTHLEGLGIALIEAMAAGVPVIASDVPACREVLRDGKLGALVQPNDPEALSGALHNVFADWEATVASAARARETVTAEFSAEVMARRYLHALTGRGSD